MAKGGFPMGGGNMQQLMRQAQKMQQDLQKKQAELNEATFTAQAGGGMVTYFFAEYSFKIGTILSFL